MAKLLDDEYLVRSAMLHRVWEHNPRAYSFLTHQQQRDLHDYFLMSQSMTNEELLAHRKRVSRSDPSLPQRAGRALKELLRPTPKPAKSKASISPLAKPEIELEKLAGALLDLAKSLPPEKQEELAKEGRALLERMQDQEEKAA